VNRTEAQSYLAGSGLVANEEIRRVLDSAMLLPVSSARALLRSTISAMPQTILATAILRSIQGNTIAANTVARPSLKRRDRIRKSCERVYRSHIAIWLADAEAKLIRELSRQEKAAANAVSEGMLSAAMKIILPGLSDNFAELMSSAAQQSFVVSARGPLTDLAEGEVITPYGIAREFALKRENKIANCPQEIFDEIQAQLNEGLKEGETMDELSARVSSAFDNISDGRALLIAQTEAQSAYGTARSFELEQMGVKTKIWVTSDDELVRSSHRQCAAEGPIPIDQPFSNGLMFPGDPDSLDAGEVINCRCYLERGDEEPEVGG
jgi:hypothetical protein